MPVTYLDMGLAAIMLISGLLAMVRGFVREVLSIASWALAAFSAYMFYPRLLPIAKQYISSDLPAQAASIGGIFLVTLIVVSLITIRISDAILDSRIGVIDRTLGFCFGLGRGLIIMVVAYLFFAWLVAAPQRPEFVKNARSLPLLEQTGKWLMSVLPDNPEDAILSRLKKARPEGDTPVEQGPQGSQPPAATPAPTTPAPAPQRRSQVQPDPSFQLTSLASTHRFSFS